MANSYQDNLKVQRDYYAKTAADYDRWHVDPASAQIVSAWNIENLKKFLNNKKINNCLDLGCGTGRLLADLEKIGEKVYGVDASPEILAVAGQKFPQVEFAAAEATALPYPDNFFDLVVVNGALHHFFALDETCREVNRILKPAGVFAILGEPNQGYNKKNIFWYFFILTMALRKIFGRQRAGGAEIEPDAETFKPEQIRLVLDKNNFDLVEFYSYDYLPRLEGKFFLKYYARLLDWESKTLAKAFPLRGSALQAFARKH